MAPGATKGAALQEHGRANPRPVLDRVLLDVEDQTVLHDQPALGGSVAGRVESVERRMHRD